MKKWVSRAMLTALALGSVSAYANPSAVRRAPGLANSISPCTVEAYKKDLDAAPAFEKTLAKQTSLLQDNRVTAQDAQMQKFIEQYAGKSLTESTDVEVAGKTSYDYDKRVPINNVNEAELHADADAFPNDIKYEQQYGPGSAPLWKEEVYPEQPSGWTTFKTFMGSALTTIYDGINTLVKVFWG